jgi:hypothetical protein
MATYLRLFRLTPSGIAQIRDSPARDEPSASWSPHSSFADGSATRSPIRA